MGVPWSGDCGLRTGTRLVETGRAKEGAGDDWCVERFGKPSDGVVGANLWGLGAADPGTTNAKPRACAKQLFPQKGTPPIATTEEIW